MNNRVGRTGLLIAGKPEQIRQGLLALQKRFGPDMPLKYVLSLQMALRLEIGAENRIKPSETSQAG
ncbi:hypothetical protein SAMN04487895_106120 [Paenibacillus sophorae]|uniref:Uncharacterized protein n=1 Tax=Paenibacillus sophorae TaxID=1333845 RepID=A0A1H8N926_9BACL|nr:hypothetical protein [Paenibacillus sophorae]QWU14723.1 hypothetical protein KP014_22785 [Paenibacillus sophorae]SEO26201.1 hypothetical protein SAMN04487895_106120 [Paenibacillus sophorae]